MIEKSKSIEVEANTTEEAIKLALKTLKMPRKKVKIEFLSEEAKGLFGMPGAKPAKIRATIKEKS
ncbi:MAG: Jag N-terminal domain-containing protein [Candidatus Omnitrophica bacterium]|nr:Jag N-terminal domain-containing protein [Candidatus Omnitrophota bacterium]